MNLDEMLRRATDGGDHEWGWYVDDVPLLVARVRELEGELAAATDECHTLYARVHELEQESEPIEAPPGTWQNFIGSVEAVFPTDLPGIERVYGLPAGFLDGCEDMPTHEVMARIQAGVESILPGPLTRGGPSNLLGHTTGTDSWTLGDGETFLGMKFQGKPCFCRKAIVEPDACPAEGCDGNGLAVKPPAPS